MEKLSVCILFGGVSPEHEVSLRSAESVLNNIDKNKYNIFPVGITKGGEWILYGGREYADLPSGKWQQHPDFHWCRMKKEIHDIQLPMEPAK